MTEPRATDLIDIACRLWAGSFYGLLSTHSTPHPGYPFGSIAPYCLDDDGRPLLLLSHLAQHSRNLQRDPRCGLLLSDATQGDPQQAARLSVMADCIALGSDESVAVDRYFRYFPHARPYFEQLNFRFFRLDPVALHLNAGFAAARWIGTDRVVEKRGFAPGQESLLIQSIADRAADLANFFVDHPTDPAAPVEIAGIDRRGVDLRRGQSLRRIAFKRELGVEAHASEVLAMF